MDQVEAVLGHGAVAAGLGEAVVGGQAPEVTAPLALGIELESLAGADVADRPELAFGMGATFAPIRLVHHRSHLHDAVGLPVPTAEFISDHIQMLGEVDRGDEDLLGRRGELDFVLAGIHRDVCTGLDSREGRTHRRDKA